ncbi:hypothetical protein [Enterococcus sp. AZ196]|uniref:hypothetical protein n=1 Tax=Enterococcus sp. AZ196 TaxID=2774659 RepID=UPI003D299E3A
MGNRCYLTTETTQIFESNNSLPTFWLMGLSSEHLVLLSQQLETYELAETLSQKEFERRLAEKQFGVIDVSFEDFLQNLDFHSEYLSAVYPDLLPLYHDFQELIAEESSYSDNLELIYLDYLLFLEDTADLLAAFIELFEAMNSFEETSWINEEDILGSTIGYDDFSNHHGHYLSVKYQPDNRSADEEPPLSTKASLFYQLIKSGFFFTLSFILAIGSIWMILDSMTRIAGVAGGLLFGMGTVIFGGNLRHDLKSLRERKGIEKIND